MRIDGLSVSRKEAEDVNRVIDSIFDIRSDRKVAQNLEEFVQKSFGPDAIEMVCSGEDWVIHDSDLSYPVTFEADGTTHVASHELFAACSKLSPFPRITWHLHDDTGEAHDH